WLASPVLGLALALLVCVPVLAWLAQRAARPWRTTLAALRGAIGSLRERDFSVTIATPRIEELRTLVEAYNGLGAVLRRERFDLYQRELLLDTVLQTTPHALVLSNDAGRIVYGNIAARALLNGGSKLEGLELEVLLREQPRELRTAVAGSDDTL
ncbi:two component system sensor histidine kinase, partial [mine drainage metagenome]